MRISTGRNAKLIIPFTVACLLLVSCVMVFGAGFPPGYVTLIIVPLFAFLVIPYSFVICTSIEMDAKECAASFIRFRRSYPWDELLTKRMEDYADRATYKSPYDRAVLFSTKLLSKPARMKPMKVALVAVRFFFSILSSLFVGFS